jgi:hypothetical protein
MQQEILETVLTEVLEDMKIAHQAIRELTEQVKGTKEQVEGFDQKVKEMMIYVPPIDTKPFEKIVAQCFQNVCTTVENQPKNVIHQRRLLLFPETNAGQYYKIIFGRLIPWGLLFAGMCFVFSIIGKSIDNSAQEDVRKFYYEEYSAAWQQLDSTLDKSGR